jgi:hypothetical protein
VCSSLTTLLLEVGLEKVASTENSFLATRILSILSSIVPSDIKWTCDVRIPADTLQLENSMTSPSTSSIDETQTKALEHLQPELHILLTILLK